LNSMWKPFDGRFGTGLGCQEDDDFKIK
jgi:hypothetical protein